MPTDLPRLTITMRPEHYELLKRISVATKVPISGIISDSIERSFDVLEAWAVRLQQQESATKDMFASKARIRRVGFGVGPSGKASAFAQVEPVKKRASRKRAA